MEKLVGRRRNDFLGQKDHFNVTTDSMMLIIWEKNFRILDLQMQRRLQ